MSHLSNKRKSWNQTSASQLKTFKQCPKKWWLEKIERVPKQQKDYFYYGTALHSAAERYLKADASGRDKDGNVVELFPEGWDQVWENEELVYKYTPEESQRVQKQVEQAIANGVLSRSSDTKVEHRFEKVVGHTGVKCIGYIDVMKPYENTIEDHKTAKNARYASTKGKLNKGDTQLLIYAKVLLDNLRSGPGADPDKITVRHNIFRKDGAEPYSVETDYSVDRINEAWGGLVGTTEIMRVVSKIKSLADVPEPEDEKACFAYGGCPFVRICGRQESIVQYGNRVRKLNASRLAQLNQGDGMGVFDKVLDKRGPTMVAPEEKATPLNAPVEEPATEQAQEPVQDRKMAPWADPECAACEDNDVGGFSSKGAVCRICTKTLDSRGVPEELRPDNFVVGDFTWKSKVAEPEPEPVVTKQGPAEVITENLIPEAPNEEDEWDEIPDSMPKGKVAKKSKKERKPRKKKSFTLCVGCAPLFYPAGAFVAGDELFLKYRAIFCEEKGVDNYWEYDAFARRDAMAIAAEALSEELGTKMVVFSSANNPDLKAFIESLKPLASTLIVGTVG